VTNQSDIPLALARYWLQRPWTASRRLTGKDLAALRQAFGLEPFALIWHFDAEELARIDASTGRVGFLTTRRYFKAIKCEVARDAERLAWDIQQHLPGAPTARQTREAGRVGWRVQPLRWRVLNWPIHLLLKAAESCQQRRRL
jgi:hypothetical protein